MTYHQEGKSRKPVERRESSRLQSAAKLLRSNKHIEHNEYDDNNYDNNDNEKK